MEMNKLRTMIREMIMAEKVYHFKNKITGGQLDMDMRDDKAAEKQLKKLGSRYSMAERISMLKEDSDYQEFFRSALKKFGSKTPAEMSDEEKTKFFNYIDSAWDSKKEMDEEQKLRMEVRKIFEVKGLTKKFDKIVSNYHQLQSDIQKVESEMDKAKSAFLKKFKAAKDDKAKEKIKKDHIVNMKKLALSLKTKADSLKKKLKDSEAQFNSAIDKLAVPDEADLLENKLRESLALDKKKGTTVGIKGWVKKNLAKPILKAVANELNKNAEKVVKSDFPDQRSNIKMSYELVVQYIEDVANYIVTRNKGLDSKMNAIFKKYDMDFDGMDNDKQLPKLSLESISFPLTFPYKSHDGSHKQFEAYVKQVIQKHVIPIFKKYNDSLEVEIDPEEKKRDYSLENLSKELYNQLEEMV